MSIVTMLIQIAIVLLLTQYSNTEVHRFHQQRGWLHSVVSDTKILDVNLEKVISVTEEEFLSICLDPYLKHDEPGKPWETLDFNNPRIYTLAAGLAPSLLRFGGTDADWSYFYNVTSLSDQAEIWKLSQNFVAKPAFIVPFFPQDIDNLHRLAKSAGGKLLYDLNIQLRFGKGWNPNNALEMMKYIQQKAYPEDMYFELGNEPDYPELKISGEQIGKDSLTLRNMLDNLEGLKNAKVVGPDIGISTGGRLLNISMAFANTVKKNITALTCHHYYFKGPGANISEFLDVEHFDSFEYDIQVWRDAVRKASGEKLDVWVGETSDSYDYGTPNITDKYISGLLWLDKLGIAARNEYKLVARQDFFGGNYPLLSPNLYPNPDYWLSHAYKMLVGKEVLKVNITGMSTKGQLVRIYAHCTSPRAKYAPGSITVYFVNLVKDQKVQLILDSRKFGSFGDIFEFLPHNNDLLSQIVHLNGVPLTMVDDHTLPKLNPVQFSLQNPVILAPASYGFLVFKYTNASICKV